MSVQGGLHSFWQCAYVIKDRRNGDAQVLSHIEVIWNAHGRQSMRSTCRARNDWAEPCASETEHVTSQKFRFSKSARNCGNCKQRVNIELVLLRRSPLETI
ncbi:uncharacterized protein LOC119163805 [Rhipicephalus microplus]|uniref:uncharacterized protein LOC119163805 n=1 Tax=Rhipicephalus microplus TaxID=6941 RepID=UPI003F6CAE98